MDNQSSSDNSLDTTSAPASPVVPSQENTAPSTEPLSVSTPPAVTPHGVGFNEQQQWNDIQVALTAQEVTLKARVEPVTGESGIAADSYQRRMRELRQKLYDAFIKKG